ncbi:MAG: ATP-binding cassette domain-containing protein [Lachnospiraceae bacterium]|nr:ATP-binding cassette domain-containing protein [Lachnospiraceae bacterium]
MKLEINDITKTFGEKKVLKGITLCAESGTALGILGRNGAGKTTTLRILMNVFPADSGTICLEGEKIDYERIRIGYLPEERGLYPKKTIIEQLVYFARLKGMGRQEAVKAADQWLEHLEMGAFRNKRLDTLSKGNQQKIQLITAVIHDPQMIILDEPFSGLDPVNAALLKDVVREEVDRGKIVLFSSHQMGYIEEFCDRIAILNGGEMVLKGRVEEIKKMYPRDRLLIRSLQETDIAKAYPSACEHAQQGLIFHLEQPSCKREMMAQLTDEFDIDEISVLEPSLSDIFVEYTRDRI